MGKEKVEPHTSDLFFFITLSSLCIPVSGEVGDGSLQRMLKLGPKDSPTPSSHMHPNPKTLPEPCKHARKGWKLEEAFERILGDR